MHNIFSSFRQEYVSVLIVVRGDYVHTNSAVLDLLHFLYLFCFRELLSNKSSNWFVTYYNQRYSINFRLVAHRRFIIMNVMVINTVANISFGMVYTIRGITIFIGSVTTTSIVIFPS
jgi:hypothetical protein